ncbi:hypothetical protein DPMN_179284 [Dreissena polymorpha]|uniref:Uncharacterized protein n=1 Tax=Dreissena polymorpha TaxID=45954 RepID=A0A9D4EFS4_DREPO|nr:hypothetical protein DPMN_179284 [Dreissena polymorpha]
MERDQGPVSDDVFNYNVPTIHSLWLNSKALTLQRTRHATSSSPNYPQGFPNREKSWKATREVSHEGTTNRKQTDRVLVPSFRWDNTMSNNILAVVSGDGKQGPDMEMCIGVIGTFHPVLAGDNNSVHIVPNHRGRLGRRSFTRETSKTALST